MTDDPNYIGPPTRGRGDVKRIVRGVIPMIDQVSKRSPHSTPSETGSAYPGPVERLVGEFARLPGIGRRTAERLAFHVVKSPATEALRLAEAVQEVKRSVKHCVVCFNFTDGRVCTICENPRRNASMIMAVEQPRDLIAMEFTGMYRGVYHVLMGRVSPLEGIGPEDLTIADLLRRIDDPAANARGVAVAEVILALNPTLESDGTALLLAEEFRSRRVKVTRLSRGLAAGARLELSSKAVLADALEGRQPM